MKNTKNIQFNMDFENLQTNNLVLILDILNKYFERSSKEKINKIFTN